jgi:hypothetical protein
MKSQLIKNYASISCHWTLIPHVLTGFWKQPKHLLYWVMGVGKMVSVSQLGMLKTEIFLRNCMEGKMKIWVCFCFMIVEKFLFYLVNIFFLLGTDDVYGNSIFCKFFTFYIILLYLQFLYLYPNDNMYWEYKVKAPMCSM